MAILISLTLLGIFCCLVYLYFAWNLNYWKRKKVDGPKPRLFFGTFPGVVTQKRNIVYDINEIYRAYKHKNKFVGVFMSRNPQILVLDPELAREIYIRDFRKFRDNEVCLWIDKKNDPIVALNPFLLPSEPWKEKRSQVIPALTMAKLKPLYPAIQEVGTRMVEYIKKNSRAPPKGGINAKDLCLRYNAEVLGTCLYGIDAGTFANENCPLYAVGNRMANRLPEYLYRGFLISVLPLLRYFLSTKIMPAEGNQFFLSLLNDAIKLREKVNCDRADFLNYLIELKKRKNLSDIDVAGHAMTFFLDGFETAAGVVASTLYLLGRNRNVQNKLREEIVQNLGENGKLSFDKLVELPYLDQCVHENLRLFPPLMVISKICTESCELENFDRTKSRIEKGTVVHIPMYSIHHDNDYFHDPELFLPERFNPEFGGVKKFRDSFTFFPFGDGPRMCLGMRLGLVLIKASITEILTNFEVSLTEKTKTEPVIDPHCFLSAIDGGVWLNFKEIKG